MELDEEMKDAMRFMGLADSYTEQFQLPMYHKSMSILSYWTSSNSHFLYGLSIYKAFKYAG